MGGERERRIKLTKRAIDALRPPESGRVTVWDTELKGFGLRLGAISVRNPAGTRVYVVKYRVGSVQRWQTIGAHGSPWTPEKARDAARIVLAKVADGKDPSQSKREIREALTVAELIDAYLIDGPATKPAKRANTWMHDTSNLKRHILPLLGSKLAGCVSKTEAARVFSVIVAGGTAARIKTGKHGLAVIRGGEGAARRTRITAAACWAWGLEYDYIKGVNPWSGMKLTAAPERERFLSRDEAGRLLKVLAEHEGAGLLSSTFADALRVLLLTGARKTEVLGLRWAEIDFGRAVASLPPERTKAGGKTGVRRIHLSPGALAVLAPRKTAHDALGEAGESPFVFPGARGSGHATGLRRAFLGVCEAAALDRVRVHDLRHSFASFALADGASLFLIGKALGHANARTTERYAHLSGDPLADLAAAVDESLRRTGGEAPPVVGSALPA